MLDPVEVERLSHQHDERLKELGALHDASRLLRDPSLSLDALLAAMVARLPAAMQHVDDTIARIVYGDHAAMTPGFVATAWVLVRAFETTDGRRGVLEVAYRSEHPAEQEGPFLTEERALIDSLAEMLCAELDRRSTAAAARDREATLALAASTADLAVWEWSAEDNRVTWSPELVRMLGRENAATGLGESNAIHPEDRERVIAAVRAALADPDTVFDLEFRAIRADGSDLWLGARGRVVDTEGRRRVLGVLADITRRKTLERSLIQLQKMEAMGRVAAGVAHDFNNLLAVIQLNTGELLDLLGTDDPRRELATEIHDVLVRGVALTQQLLAFSRKSEVKPVVLRPDAAVRSAEAFLKRLVGVRVRFVVELGSTREIHVDATQLDQVVMNLVVNARDAVGDSGAITITTRDADVDAEAARLVVGARPGRYVVITVADTGHGMSAATQARLFEPFFTTKPPGQGTGLGLSVVFGIVQQSSGFVTVDSAPGAGARFHVHFPATD